jgi:hypothetical protein
MRSGRPTKSTEDKTAEGERGGGDRRTTVLDIGFVVVIGNLAIRTGVRVVVMEIIGAVERVLSVSIGRSCDPHSRSCRHVINHSIHDYFYSGGFASRDHVNELGLVSRSTDKVVSHRLVSGPPLRPLDVFGWGRNLDRFVPLRSQEIFTFSSHIIPTPFEQLNRCAFISRARDCPCSQR